MRAFLAIIIMTLLCGCATNRPIESFDTAKLRAIEHDQLCLDYGTLSRSGRLSPTAKNQFREVLTEKGITEKEFEYIDTQRLFIGMSRGAMLASWGKPNRENRTVNQFGSHIQHVYGTYSRYSEPVFVYTENGKVASWQD